MKSKVIIQFMNNELSEQTYTEVSRTQCREGAFEITEHQLDNSGWQITLIPLHRIRKVTIYRGYSDE